MKKKAEITAPAELAAPAVLRRLQSDAAKFSNQIDECEARIAAMRDISPNADELFQKDEINRVEGELITARDNFGKTAKILLSYDRGIDSARKEGEKISVEEVAEQFAQWQLTVDLSIEQLGIADAQSAALCDDPAKWHATHVDNYRAAKDGMIASAKSEGVLKGWLKL